MTRISLGGGYYESSSLPISAMLLDNWYVNIPQVPGALSKATLFGTPGASMMTTTGSIKQSNRGSHTKSGIPYFVNGTSLYRLDESVSSTGVRSYSAVLLGAIPGAGRVSFADNGSQLMLVAGGLGWIYNESAAPQFQQITDPDFTANGSPIDVVFMDSFFWVATDQQKITKSAANNGLAWNALDFGAAEADPDAIVGLVVHKNQLFALGSITTEAFQNIGAGGFPLQRVSGFVLDKGLSAPFLAINSTDTFMFVGSGKNESPAVWALSGASVEKVSNTAIDFKLSAMPSDEIAQGFSWSYGESGAYFIGFTFPKFCFVYDLTARKWHTRSSLLTDARGKTSIVPWRANSVVSAYAKTIIFDIVDGRAGHLSKNIFDEYGNEIVRTFTLPTMSNGADAFSIASIELALESGVGNYTKEPVARMSISKDGGKTFKSERFAGFGRTGENSRRAIWRRVGRFMRFAVLKFEFSDAVKPVVIYAEAKFR